MTQRFFCLLGFLVLFGFSVPVVNAQEAGEELVKEYRRPGFPTMTIFVMGGVQQPGVWRFERDADFYEIMAVLSATGLSATAQVATKQAVIIRVYRESGANRTQVYQQELNDVLQGLESPPRLQDQDILVVETVTRPTRRITLQSVSSVIAAASTAVLLYLRIFVN